MTFPGGGPPVVFPEESESAPLVTPAVGTEKAGEAHVAVQAVEA
jgi:hypothetical protein